MQERLYLRGRVWWCWFYDADGVIQRKSTKQRDKTAARAVLREFERQATDPRYAAANATSVHDALERMIENRIQRGRADGTLHMYRVKAGHVRRVFGADTPLSRIDAKKIDGYLATRLAEGAARTTIGKELTTIRAMLKVARRRGEFTGDIAAIMPDGWSLEYRPRQRFLTEPEAQALLAELVSDRQAHVAFILATGARWSESMRARAKDIRLDMGKVKLHGTKTIGADREVPIVAFGWPLLRRVVDLRGTEKGLLFRRWINVRRDLATACKNAKIADVSPNDLRRTPSTWLRQMGVPPSEIAPFLGHVDSRMVERVYGRIPVDALGAVLRARCETVVQAPGQKTALVAPVASPGAPKIDEKTRGNMVPRDGIEPPTRGFSIPPPATRSSLNQADRGKPPRACETVVQAGRRRRGS